MQPQDLSDELLTLIHNGAAPLDRRDHRAYYNYITVWLDESPLLTPRALADVIKEVQGQAAAADPEKSADRLHRALDCSIVSSCVR